MKQKYIILAICGKSGSGKDTTLNRLLDICPSLHKIVPCTTRPPRDYELDGYDYTFVPSFNPNKDKDWLEYCIFNDWYYYTSIKNLEKDAVNVGIFSPAAIKQLRMNPSINLIVVECVNSDKERLERCLNRECAPDCHEICRRFLADEEDFKKENFDIDRFYYPTISLDDKVLRESLQKWLLSFAQKYKLD